MPVNPGPATSLQIWEVARATSAAPFLFTPISVEDKIFRDGGMIANNPSEQALRDVAFLHRDDLTHICLVSIGSGILLKEQSGPTRNKSSLLRNWKRTIQTLRETRIQTEATYKIVYETCSDHRIPYFRFNPELGREILPDDWDKGIEESAIRYLESPEIEEQLRKCASAVVSYMFNLRSDNNASTFSGELGLSRLVVTKTSSDGNQSFIRSFRKSLPAWTRMIASGRPS
jgi:hypothetical protein